MRTKEEGNNITNWLLIGFFRCHQIGTRECWYLLLLVSSPPCLLFLIFFARLSSQARPVSARVLSSNAYFQNFPINLASAYPVCVRFPRASCCQLNVAARHDPKPKTRRNRWTRIPLCIRSKFQRTHSERWIH